MKNINYCLQEYKLSIGIVNTQYDQQFIQWMVRGLTKLRQLEQYQECTKSVRLPIDKITNTANFPADFSGRDAMIQIGVCRDGHFINFDKNEDLCLPGEFCPCNDTQHIQNVMNACCGNDGTYGAWPFWAYPVWGEPFSYSYSAGSYGIGPGFYGGGYKIFEETRQFVFDQCVKGDSFNLVYMGDFMTDTGNALIPDDMVEIMIAWLEYCKKRFSPDVVMRREAPAAKITWYQAVRDYNSANQKLNKSAWLKLFRRLSYMGVKA